MKVNQQIVAVAVLAICAVGTIKARGEAPVAAEVRPATRVVIAVQADGTINVGQATVKPSELPVVLKVLVGLPEKPAILMRVDKDVPYTQVVAILDACKDAGLANVAITTPPK